MNNSINIQFLGGSNEVGSLAMVLELDGMRLLFEYGMTPSNPPSFPLPPPPVDLTLLTHAHLDHSGMIPWLCAREDHRILATDLTKKISNVLYKDTAKIAKAEGYASPYDNADIKEAEHSFISVEPNQRKSIGDDYEVRFHSAGHIPGSLMFELVGSKKTS